jgi:3-hydroxymyristoyl/3-hydroxydecanoyl-(acyl carrier protein) dehydratase
MMLGSLLCTVHDANRIVAIGPEGEVTLGGLWQRAAAIAALLPPAQPGSLVAFAFGEDQVTLAAALLGTWLAGHAAALPESARREHVAPILARPDVVAFLHDTGVGRGVFAPRALRACALPPIPTAVADAPDRVLLVTFTNQLEGPLRERRWTSQHLLQVIDEILANMRLLSDDVMITALAPTFESAVLAGLLAPLRGGARIAPNAPRGIEQLLAMANTTTSAVALVPPGALSRVADCNASPALRRIFCAAPPRPYDAIALHNVHGLEVVRVFAGGDDDPTAAQTLACEQLLALPSVRDAVIVVTEATAIVAVAAPSAAGDRQNLIEQCERTASPALPANVPTMVRVLTHLPRDENGRIEPARLFLQFGLGRDGRAVVRTLDWIALAGAAGEHRFRTVIPERYAFFQGHFTTYPVLAGAVQLHEIVLPCVRRAHPALGAVRRLANIKFLARIAPGDTVEVAIRATNKAGELDFELHCGDTRCTAGRIALEQTAEAEGR